MSSVVIHIHSEEEFSSLEQRAIRLNIPLFVKFSAVWCRPCQIIAPKFEQFSEENVSKMLAAHVDVEECEVIAQRFDIAAMPTFVVLKPVEGKLQVVDTMKGANEAALSALFDVNCS